MNMRINHVKPLDLETTSTTWNNCRAFGSPHCALLAG